MIHYNRRGPFFLLTLFGVAVALNGCTGTAPVPENKDALRWLPVENADVFQTMGARVFRLHVPESLLATHSQIAVKTSRDAGKPNKVLAIPIGPRGAKRNGVDVTFVMYWDTPIHEKVTRIHYLLSTPNSSEGRSSGPPIPGFNGYTRTNDLGDLTKGLELCALHKSDPNGPAEETVRYTLWLE